MRILFDVAHIRDSSSTRVGAGEIRSMLSIE